MTFKVVVVGRPNVGKSTLFNRLVGKRAAIVHPTPGVTRDRREGRARLGPLRFTIVDTAGLEEADPDSLVGRMQAQTRRALEGADAILLVIDAQAGLTPLDRHFAQAMRKLPTPVILIANKAESKAAISGVAEAHALGLGDPIAVSAEHGQGLGALYDALAPLVEAAEPGAGEQDGAEAEAALALAIVGRPNVGKSTLVNRLLGEERVLTGPEPGVTRDAVTAPWSWRGRPVRLVDTAGLRRRARVVEDLERLGVAEARRALDLAHVVALVVDATMAFDRQDLVIAGAVAEEGRALVIVVNKWDLVEDRRGALAAMRHALEHGMPDVRGVPVVTLSALTGRGVDRLMPAVFAAYDVWNRRVPTGRLNRWLADVLAENPPPIVAGRRIKLRYAVQAKTRPPTFALFGNRPDALPDSYRRYLVNRLRSTFDLPGVPIRLIMRRGENPYASSNIRSD
ncbi:MAG: ribosome biogenesis GTPase Der [Alphaproteobacteria bacterium]